MIMPINLHYNITYIINIYWLSNNLQIIMSTINHSCDSLYNLSLNQLKYVSMDENILQFVLKFNIPPMLMDIIWKVIYIMVKENYTMFVGKYV